MWLTVVAEVHAQLEEWLPERLEGWHLPRTAGQDSKNWLPDIERFQYFEH